MTLLSRQQQCEHLLLFFCRIFTAIRKSHPQNSDATTLELDKNLPTIQEIHSAFAKIRQICVLGELSSNITQPV